MNPKISIIMPVYNAGEYLQETIEALQNQTFGDFEVICVDDGSADHSVEILQQTMRQDDRFLLVQQKNAGAGAARNRGFVAARGEYAIFLDSDDLFSPKLLEKLLNAAEDNQADIAACHFSRFSADGEENRQEGFYTKWIPKGLTVFSYRDCPDHIMRVINPVPWNKLYRSDFIRKHHLKFEEISSTNDITFASVSVAVADRVVCVPEHLVRYRIGHAGTISSAKAGKLNNVRIAVLSAYEQALALPQGQMIKKSVLSFVIGNFLYALSHLVKDFSASEAADFYRMAHEVFNRKEFADVEPGILHSEKQYCEFCSVRDHDYETMKQMIGRRLIVSLTSYPKRIGTLGPVLDTIYAQTRQPDEVVLWLAEEQFPGREADLPEDLRQLMAENRLTVRWCEDLKPHKKYFYTLQAYPDDLVVTFDDDLLYSKYILSSLYASYLQYPKAVSTVRAHLIMVSEDQKIMPYGSWIQETDACIYQPSMQLMATGGAGVLYPPHLLKKELFDAEAIQENCLWADDLWLKMMQLMSDVPVVLARQFELLRYLPDSQDEALCHYNVAQKHNDEQLDKVIKWTDEKYGQGALVRKLTQSGVGVELLGIGAVSHHLDEERKANRRKWLQSDSKARSSEYKAKFAEEKRHQAEEKRKETEAKLRQSEGNLRQAESKLRQAENKLRQTENKLARTEDTLCRREQRIRELEPLASVGGQYQDLGRFLRELKAERGLSVGWCVKYGLYLLAWIPAKLLIATVYLVKNGAGASVKRLLQKLLRRG